MEETNKMLFSLFSELKNIKAQLQQLNKTRLETFQESWIDGQDVMQLMHLSPRTLQTYRDKGILPYSQIRGKIFYKFADIENLLDSNHSTFKKSGHGIK